MHTTFPPLSSSPSPSFQSSPSINASPSKSSPNLAAPPLIVLSPCAACKILRRRCDEKCVLAPYFPPTEPQNFIIVHRVFGASNIIKCLQGLPECQRSDAVSSMVYEANARIRNPVHGCVGAISQLQKQVIKLQAELAKAQAETVSMQCQRDNLVALICKEMTTQYPQETMNRVLPQQQLNDDATTCYLDDKDFASTWDALWT
ncbi:hypothetical protein WN944_018415 [Citrus x changshan-huyou]|uniref:LOB domain-containing protein 1 n=2 Tax=Citrus TaxID=2706 RepID=A0ACB8L412_CITSI|nr:LOB domain-containing protein 1 [Citrus sinensis]